MATANIDFEHFIGEYKLFRPLIDVLRIQLHEELFEPILQKLPNQEKHEDAILQSRIKNIESIKRNFDEIIEKYRDPITEMDDLMAFRFILPYADEISTIHGLINNNDAYTNIEPPASPQADNKPWEFRYKETKLKLQLKPEFMDGVFKRLTSRSEHLQEFILKFKSGFNFEVQIRSFAQHAWMVVSHRLDYKPEEGKRIPEKLKPRFYSLNALMFLTDEEFIILKKESKDLLEIYRSNIRNNNYDMPIDNDSVQAYVEEAPRVSKIAKIAYKSGCKKNDNNPGSLGRVHRMLNLINIKNIQEIENLTTALSDDKIRRFFAEFCRHGAPKRSPAAIIALLFLGLNYGKLANGKIGFNKRTMDAVSIALKALKGREPV